MNARNELADVFLSIDGPALLDALDVADAILAAGYRKPRTITTAEDLDALHDASVILDAMNYCRESVRVSDGNIWRAMGPATVRASREIALPATVLYEPEPQP